MRGLKNANPRRVRSNPANSTSPRATRFSNAHARPRGASFLCLLQLRYHRRSASGTIPGGASQVRLLSNHPRITRTQRHAVLYLRTGEAAARRALVRRERPRDHAASGLPRYGRHPAAPPPMPRRSRMDGGEPPAAVQHAITRPGRHSIFLPPPSPFPPPLDYAAPVTDP